MLLTEKQTLKKMPIADLPQAQYLNKSGLISDLLQAQYLNKSFKWYSAGTTRQ